MELENSSDGRPRRVVVATTARSGSTFVAAAMREAGGLGHPLEFLNLNQVRWPWMQGIELAPTVAGRLAQWQAGVFRWEGVDALNFMYSSLEAVQSEVPGPLPVELREAYWIFLRRRDTVAQAVSLSRARYSGQWHFASAEETTREVPYLDFYSESADAAFLQEQNAGWERFFAKEGIEPDAVWFEDFRVAPEYFLNRWRGAFGLSPLAEFKPETVPVRKVGNQSSAQWRSLLETVLSLDLCDASLPRRHFLRRAEGLELTIESIRQTATTARIAFSAENQSAAPLSNRLRVWGEERPVAVAVLWDRVDINSGKHLGGVVPLPEVLAPGERFSAVVEMDLPSTEHPYRAYLLTVLAGEVFDIRLLGGNTPELAELATNP